MVLRHATTSPKRDWMPWNDEVPLISNAFFKAPVIKSNLTARRVQPCIAARWLKPDFGAKLLDSSASPYINTSSQGTNTLSMIRIASFSSIRELRG